MLGRRSAEAVGSVEGTVQLIRDLLVSTGSASPAHSIEEATLAGGGSHSMTKWCESESDGDKDVWFY